LLAPPLLADNVMPDNGSAAPALRIGSRGDDVRRLQELLKGQGYYSGPVNGAFGIGTHAAVVRFQETHSLPENGVVDTATWEALGLASSAPSSAPVESDWTLMIYMAGNNNLSSAAGRDIEEIRRVASLGRLRIVAFVKRRERAGAAQHMELTSGGANDIVEELGDVDSGDPQTVLNFVKWATNRAPARRYALILWNHGGGWEPDDLDQIYSQVRHEAVRSDTEEADISVPTRSELDALLARGAGSSKNIFLTSWIPVLSLNNMTQRAIASDDGSLHSIDTIELENLVRSIRDHFGRRLDLLGMDACLMSNLEVAYQVRNYVDVIVGSEEQEPNSGWPYTEILEALAAKSTMDSRNLGRTIVDCYISSYRGTGEQVTQCALDATRIANFMRGFDALAIALRRQLATNRSVVESAYWNTTNFRTDGSLIDIRSFCRGLTDNVEAQESVIMAANQVLTAHTPGGFVVREDHQGDTVEDCGGISVYFPKPKRNVSQFYRDLAIAEDSQWDDFLADTGNSSRRGRRA
jgi:hypothetical protein